MAVMRFKMPDLGEGLTEAEIVEWHVAPGDRVVTGQPLVSVETDKAVVEIPAPWAGTLKRILSQPGKTLRVGAVLADFETDARADRGSVVGTLPDEGPTGARPDKPVSRGEQGAGVRAMPAARALARERSIDLSSVTGTGPGGAVTREDVLAAAGAGTDAPPGWEPLTGARRAMAARMAASAEVIRATLVDVADVTAWSRLDADLLFRLARALGGAARAVPAMNAWFDAARGCVRRHECLDLAIAVDTPEGLYVPVVRNAGVLDARAFRAEADRLIAAARSRRLGEADQRGATFTLSSFGSLGGRFAELVVTPPQVAILGAGRVYQSGAAGEERQHLPLSLSFDHRAATGGDAAAFLAEVVTDVTRPE